MSLPRLRTTANTARLRRSTHHYHYHHPYTTSSTPTASPRLPIHTYTCSYTQPPRPNNNHRPYTHPHPHLHTLTQRTAFSTTSTPRASARGEPTYYEILDVPPSASQSEIKKQFYALSLKHHPDRNRNDPSASTRFARISSAYNILSNATKRSIYDHDHNIRAHGSSTHSTANPGQHPMGSYSSASANLHTQGASYAGSRPASGLSKRRGTFKGPPPSFYAHGGYGSTGRRQPGATAGGGAAAGGEGGRAKKVNQEEDPTAFIERNNVWHFNAKGHYRTQTREDERRYERRSRAMGSSINEQYIGTSVSYVLRVVVVCGILLGAGALTGMAQNDLGSGKKVSASTRRKES
ncbi:DnaJ-domain-containing protein [Aspergillus heteromorphus CBS 117.55]|uniref:DnaJ-domain-containing protein n=1 Tax=Aspergillus heteromorphus CBS 117.55 TaxID=1448321 RepID=A0A317WKJ7_9EURO|nr:DnaJ-domain-containing protein [Aspergillus heteromorphus CBS 117.55]PWY86221.1 DnaJ-domain-containing protein [Aspergillus heteromorphus CBS 117.55]